MLKVPNSKKEVPKSRKQKLLKEKKWKMFNDDVPSKVYLLLLFEYPKSKKQIAELIYNTPNSPLIKDIMSVFAALDYIQPVRSLKLLNQQKDKKIHGNEKFYRASLKPLFDFWESIYKNSEKQALEKFIKEMNRFLNSPEQMKDINFDKRTLKALVNETDYRELRRKLRELVPIFPGISTIYHENVFINEEERKKIETFFFSKEFFPIIKASFESYILPSIKNPVKQKFNALELLTRFFDILFSKIYIEKRREKCLKSDKFYDFLDGIYKIGSKEFEQMPLKEKIKALVNAGIQLNQLGTRPSNLDQHITKLGEDIGFERADTLHDGLEIIIKNEFYNMEQFSRQLYGM